MMNISKGDTLIAKYDMWWNGGFRTSISLVQRPYSVFIEKDIEAIVFICGNDMIFLNIDKGKIININTDDLKHFTTIQEIRGNKINDILDQT